MRDDEEDIGSVVSTIPGRSRSRNGTRSSSPLPVSTGPGDEKYSFSRSASPSPQASPVGSARSSTQRLPLLIHGYANAGFPHSRSFSVDRPVVPHHSSSEDSSCLEQLLEWFILKCCSLCSWDLNHQLKLHRC